MSIFALSLDSANALYGWANGALIIGAVLVLIGTIGAFWGSAIRDRYSDERISRNEVDTAKANEHSLLLAVELAKTNERAGRAEMQVAEARLDTAKAAGDAAAANARAAEAKLDLERLKAPRTIKPEHMESFIRAMSEFKGQSVIVGAMPITHETTSFGTELVLVLTAAGLEAKANSAYISRVIGIARGVVARYRTGNEKGKKLALAFSRALNEREITAFPDGGLEEEVVHRMERTQGMPRDHVNWEGIAVVVGDKP